MKSKRSSAVLTLVIALFIGAYFAFGHIISVLNANGMLIVADFFNNAIGLVLAPFASIGWYVVVGVLALALILALIWVIRLIVYRRNVANYLSPLIFLIAVLVATVTAINGELIETQLFAKAETIVVTGYFLVTAAVIAALAIHLVVIGLARSGAVKQESLLVSEDDEVYDDEEDSVLTFDEEDDDEDEVVDEVEEVEEVVEEEPVVEYEEVDEVDEVEEVVEEEPVESVVVHEIVQTIVQEPDYDSDKLEEIVRRIVREELKDRPAPAPAPAPKPAAKPAPAPAPKPVAKPAPAPKVAPKPVEKPKPVVKPTESVARIPFVDRLATMEPDIIEKYEELHDYLLSYDVKSRLSNSGDSFRLSRKLYAKITTSGSSGLKIYLPIDITDYADTKLPLKNASHIKAYEEVPTFLYIKSDLSVRRAKQLIDDIMLTDGIVRKFQREDLDE